MLVLVTLGFAWLLSNLPEPKQFLATSFGWPSSFKAESLTILTALLVCPHHASVTINTDSASAIQMFDQVFKRQLFLNKRSLLKQSDHTIWSMIHDVVYELGLSLHLVRILAHSNAYYNDQGDLLAKDAVNYH